MRADASRGTAGVFINGRQITSGEKAYIEQLCQTPVIPGRYWILFNGLGGYEGGPAIFNLGQCPGLARASGGGRSMSRTYCDEQWQLHFDRRAGLHLDDSALSLSSLLSGGQEQNRLRSPQTLSTRPTGDQYLDLRKLVLG